MKQLSSVLLALLATVSAPAMALERELEKVGEARLEILVWPIYESRLYSADGRYVEGQRPVRLDIEYLRGIDAEELVARTEQEWQHQGVTHERQGSWLAQLAELWTDVADGDVLGLLVDERDVSTFYYNGERLGAIEDPDFSRQFLGIWLSPQTSRPELRLALLGRR